MPGYIEVNQKKLLTEHFSNPYPANTAPDSFVLLPTNCNELTNPNYYLYSINEKEQIKLLDSKNNNLPLVLDYFLLHNTATYFPCIPTICYSNGIMLLFYNSFYNNFNPKNTYASYCYHVDVNTGISTEITISSSTPITPNNQGNTLYGMSFDGYDMSITAYDSFNKIYYGTLDLNKFEISLSVINNSNLYNSANPAELKFTISKRPEIILG